MFWLPLATTSMFSTPLALLALIEVLLLSRQGMNVMMIHGGDALILSWRRIIVNMRITHRWRSAGAKVGLWRLRKSSFLRERWVELMILGTISSH